MTIGAGQLRVTALLKNNNGSLDPDLTQTWTFSDLRGTLGANLAAGGFKITGLGVPSSDSDTATKGYVDGLINSLNWKEGCIAATTAALPACTYANGSSGVGATLTADANGALSIDGVSPSVADRVLIKNQASAAQNGIYTVTATGGAGAPFVLTRAVDMDQSPEVSGAIVQIEQGTTNADLSFFTTADSPTMGTTAISWSAYGSTYTAGDGISISSGAISVRLESSNPSLKFTGGELGLKIWATHGLSGGANGVYALIDGSTTDYDGSGNIIVKDLGITPAKLSFKVASQILSNTDFTLSSGVSSATLSTAVLATAVTSEPGLVRLVIDGVELSVSGTVLAYDASSTPDADGDWRISSSTLQVYGDLTAVSHSVRVTYPVANS